MVEDYAIRMSAERDELRELVERLPDEQVPSVLAAARHHLQAAHERPWPPAFFGAGRAGRTDTAARSEELLDEGELREVATLDHRHFTVVRPRHVPALTLLPH
jgi:hypothetical protein